MSAGTPSPGQRSGSALRRVRRLLMFTGMALAALAIRQQLSRPKAERTWTGTIAGVPYDFRPPTPARLRAKWWNPDSPRLFTPHTFGVGWSINLYRLFHRGGSAGKQAD